MHGVSYAQKRPVCCIFIRLYSYILRDNLSRRKAVGLTSCSNFGYGLKGRHGCRAVCVDYASLETACSFNIGLQLLSSLNVFPDSITINTPSSQVDINARYE